MRTVWTDGGRPTGVFDPIERRDRGGFGPAWQVKSTAAFSLGGGVQLFGSVVARRGYDLPLFMAETLGSDVAQTGPGFYVDPAVIWDTDLRVRKRIKSTGRMQIDLLGEASNFVNINPRTGSVPVSQTLTSRTLRFGAIFGF